MVNLINVKLTIDNDIRVTIIQVSIVDFPHNSATDLLHNDMNIWQ